MAGARPGVPGIVVTGLAVAALAVALLLLALGDDGSPPAQATSATPTPAPTPTPKAGNDGNLSGMYDVLVHAGDKASGLYHCIARIDHDAATDLVHVATQCYSDTTVFDDPRSDVPVLPGEGPDSLPGPPPPRPYSAAPPAKGSGSLAAGRLTVAVCFANLGGPFLGPNAIAIVVINDAKAQLAGGPPSSTPGTMTGWIYLYTQQAGQQCQDKAGSGPVPVPLPINFARYGGVKGQTPSTSHVVLWRPGPFAGATVLDWDGDGCSDEQELDKQQRATCGDDPYNRLDSNQTDISGSYLFVVTEERADWDTTGNALAPGVYHVCIADLQQSAKDVATRLFCYTDSAGITVNPEASGTTTCPPAPTDQCGDGLLGPAPPRPFADVDDQHTALTGQINKLTNSIELSGCFEDRDGFAPSGHVYWRTTDLGLHTGRGTLSIWKNQALADCQSGTPAGDPLVAELDVARQATKTEDRDSDADGCPDKRELSDNPQIGGLRDPSNRWDYFNPTKDGQNRVDDILAVVNQYFEDATLPDGDPNPGYTEQTDRTGVAGANPWNLGPPNGQQRVDDVLAAVKVYFHDC